MAEAFRCDRCGCYVDEEYSERSTISHPINYRIVDLRNRSYDYGNTGLIRLCPICSDELQDFMANAPKERYRGVYIPPEEDEKGDDV